MGTVEHEAGDMITIKVKGKEKVRDKIDELNGADHISECIKAKAFVDHRRLPNTIEMLQDLASRQARDREDGEG